MKNRPRQESDILIETELFIELMKKETGVSKRFLDVVRPSIERAFLEVSKELRHECLAAIETICRNQAKIEKNIKQSIKMVPDFNCGLKQDDRWSIN